MNQTNLRSILKPINKSEPQPSNVSSPASVVPNSEVSSDSSKSPKLSLRKKKTKREPKRFNFGVLVKQYRIKRELSQTDLANAAGVSQAMIAQIENIHRYKKSPNLDISLIIVHLLQIPVRDLSTLYIAECAVADKRLKKIRGRK